jgi:hypothetical protein
MTGLNHVTVSHLLTEFVFGVHAADEPDEQQRCYDT